MKESGGVTGNVTLKFFDAETNELLSTETQHNLILGQGLFNLLVSARDVPGVDLSPAKLHSVRFGYNIADVTWTDTLAAEGFIAKDLTSTGIVLGGTPENGVTLQCAFELLASEHNGNNINQISLWIRSERDAGEQYFMLSKIKRAVIAKTSAIRIEGTWQINFAVVV